MENARGLNGGGSTCELGDYGSTPGQGICPVCQLNPQCVCGRGGDGGAGGSQ